MIPRIAFLCISCLSCSPSLVLGQLRPEAIQRVDLKPALRANAGVTRMNVIRRGRCLDSVILVAPMTASVAVNAFHGRVILNLTAAPVFNIGDGFELTIHVTGPASARVVDIHLFDPGRRASDRDWISIAVPMELRDGEDRLELRLSGGVQGDLVDDWLALARAELVAAEVAR